MTATHKGVSGMGLENKASPTGDRKTMFTAGIGYDTSGSSRQPVTNATIARPRKLIELHWLTVVCVCVEATLILIREEVDGRMLRQWLLEGHRHFGLFVLLLFFARIAVRIRAGKLPSAGTTSRLLHAAAGATHLALYALLLGLPLLGWALSNAMGKPVHLFGITLPALVGEDEDLADRLQTWHVDAAWLLLGLVLLHVAAALWHHFVVRDGVLRAMLPKRRHRKA